MIAGQDLKLSEIKEKKREAEKKIAEILAEFGTVTGVKVIGLDLRFEWLPTLGEKETTIYEINADIKTKFY